MKLYKLVYHHQLDQIMMDSSQEYADLLSLFDEKTQRKIKTAIWGFSLFIVWIIVMAMWLLSRNQVDPIPHLANTYLLIWILLAIFDAIVWPTPFSPKIKLTKLNLTISILGDIAEYLILLAMPILVLLSFK